MIVSAALAIPNRSAPRVRGVCVVCVCVCVCVWSSSCLVRFKMRWLTSISWLTFRWQHKHAIAKISLTEPERQKIPTREKKIAIFLTLTSSTPLVSSKSQKTCQTLAKISVCSTVGVAIADCRARWQVLGVHLSVARACVSVAIFECWFVLRSDMQSVKTSYQYKLHARDLQP